MWKWMLIWITSYFILNYITCSTTLVYRYGSLFSGSIVAMYRYPNSATLRNMWHGWQSHEQMCTIIARFSCTLTYIWKIRKTRFPTSTLTIRQQLLLSTSWMKRERVPYAYRILAFHAQPQTPIYYKCWFSTCTSDRQRSSPSITAKKWRRKAV
jgi:hypothetical protein